MKKCYLLLVFSLFFLPSNATNYYVDAVNGNNSNSGLSTGLAKMAIQAAADLTNPGDTVFIMNGTYVTNYGNVLSISTSGSAGAQIVYTNYPGTTPKLKAIEATYTVITITPGTSYISINGLEIEGYGVNLSLGADTIPAQGQVSCPAPGSAATSQTPLSKYNGNGITVDSRSITAGSHHITVSNCRVHDCSGAGIGFLNTDYITVSRNTVFNNSWYSIYGTSGISFNSFYNSDANTSTYRNIIINNTSYNNRMYVPWNSACQITDGNGIILDIPQSDYNGKSMVANNIVFNNGGSGIHSYQMNHVDIFNNVAYHNSASSEISAGEIYARNADDIKIYNNILMSNSGKSVNSINGSTNLVYDYNIYYGGSAVNVVGVHSLIQDPKFVNASTDPTLADFHLQTGSLAANNGDNTHTYLLDKDGNTRPIASIVDIGAYESSISGNLNTPPGTVQSTILGSGGGTGEPGAGAPYGPYDSKISTANQKSRHALIYPRTLFAGNGVLANAIIYNVQFRRNTASGTQTVPDNSIIKVYVRNESINDLGSSAFDWNSILPGAANPAVLVYAGDASPLVGNSSGWKTVPFQVPFTYTGGSLGVYVEYLQNGSIASAPDVLWFYDNGGSQPLYNTTNHPNQAYGTKAASTAGTISSSLTTNSERRPIMTIGQYPAPVTASLGTLYYVDPVGGDDLNSGFSTSTAKSSIQSAADVINPGDTVYLMNGNHTAGINITRSGTASQNITVKPLPGNTPKIYIPSTSNLFQAMTINGSYITVDNIEMQGDNANLDSTGAYNAFTLVKNGGTAMGKYNTGAITIGGPNTSSKFPSHVTIRNCKIHDFPGGGIGSIQADYTTFENNIVYNNAWYGIYGGSGISILNPFNSDAADTTKYKNIVRNNLAYNNKGLIPWIGLSPPALSDGNGIIMDVNEYGYGKAANSGTDYRGRTLVQNNVSFNNGGSGIHSFKADHVDIINNTAYGNGTVVGYADIFANGSNDVNIVNNIMYSRSGGKINIAPATGKAVNYNYNVYYNGSVAAQGLNDIIANPQFVNPSTDASVANFTLKSTSPAIDAGNDTVGRFSATDILGVTRPVGAKPDMGAYEFTGTPTPVTNNGSNIMALEVTGVALGTPSRMYPVKLLEFNASGTPTSNVIAVPSTTLGNRLMIGGTNSYDGQLMLSGDGKSLTFGGYDVDTATSSGTAYTSTKVIGRLDNTGTLDISTKIPISSGVYNGSSIRSVATQDGSGYWIAGGSGGATTNGLQYIAQSTVANPNPAPVSINTSNYKTVSVFNNRLYANTSGIAIYAGLPTATATTTSTNTFVSAYPNNTQYIFLDTDPAVGFGTTGYDVLYIADGANGANTGAGITKFYVNAASATGFTLAGTTPYDVTGSGVAIPAIAATINSQGKPTIYAVKGNALNNSIISIVDNGFRTSPMTAANTTITTLVASAGTNNIFRGIALSPLQGVTILPIDLRLFTGASVNGKNELQWMTASEMNANIFDVERSTYGVSFTKIGTVAAKNQSLGASYTFEDANLTSNIYYYRLKLVDKDGTFKYSNTIVIKSDNNPPVSFSLYPNPVVNKITVSHAKAQAGAMIQVISVNGKKTVQQTVATNATQTIMDVSALPAGAYFLIFISKNENGVVKFIK